MLAATIAIVVLKVAAICHSVDSSIVLFSDDWYLQQYVPATSNNNTISCYKLSNKLVNDTTLESTMSFKLNGKPQFQRAYFTIEKICEKNEKYIGTEYININGEYQHVCAFLITIFEGKHGYGESLCGPKNFEMSKLCVSISPSDKQKNNKYCPIQGNFEQVDHSNC